MVAVVVLVAAVVVPEVVPVAVAVLPEAEVVLAVLAVVPRSLLYVNLFADERIVYAGQTRSVILTFCLFSGAPSSSRSLRCPWWQGGRYRNPQHDPRRVCLW